MSGAAPLAAPAELLAACGLSPEATPVAIGRGAALAEYLVEDGQRWLLTVAHGREGADRLMVHLALLEALAGCELPLARPRPGPAGSPTVTVGSLHAALAACPPGQPLATIGVEHCTALGATLGRVHACAIELPGLRDAEWGPRHWKQLRERLAKQLDDRDLTLLNEEIRFHSLFRLADVPRGLVHGQLTPERVLFDGDAISALLGWGEAGRDALLHDLGLAVLAWCTSASGVVDEARVRALLGAYREHRPTRPIERGAWPVALRAAATRRWLAALGAEDTVAAAAARAVLETVIAQEERLRKLWD